MTTLWGEMKDRPDLDQWEWFTWQGLWVQIPTHFAVETEWPMRVRRRST